MSAVRALRSSSRGLPRGPPHPDVPRRRTATPAEHAGAALVCTPCGGQSGEERWGRHSRRRRRGVREGAHPLRLRRVPIRGGDAQSTTRAARASQRLAVDATDGEDVALYDHRRDLRDGRARTATIIAPTRMFPGAARSSPWLIGSGRATAEFVISRTPSPGRWLRRCSAPTPRRAPRPARPRRRRGRPG